MNIRRILISEQEKKDILSQYGVKKDIISEQTSQVTYNGNYEFTVTDKGGAPNLSLKSIIVFNKLTFVKNNGGMVSIKGTTVGSSKDYSIGSEFKFELQLNCTNNEIIIVKSPNGQYTGGKLKTISRDFKKIKNNCNTQKSNDCRSKDDEMKKLKYTKTNLVNYNKAVSQKDKYYVYNYYCKESNIQHYYYKYKGQPTPPVVTPPVVTPPKTEKKCYTTSFIPTETQKCKLPGDNTWMYAKDDSDKWYASRQSDGKKWCELILSQYQVAVDKLVAGCSTTTEPIKLDDKPAEVPQQTQTKPSQTNIAPDQDNEERPQ